MNTPSPILFELLPMERVWGGDSFQRLLGRTIDSSSPIGELWEMVDRPEAQSIVRSGPYKGKTLQELWHDHRVEIFGEVHRNHPSERFPLLIKLLDARERLSVQVHPPAFRAAELHGEPKTECWYFLHAEPDAMIYAGLKRGVTREEFESALKSGEVEKTLHCISAHPGESIFIPSGRLHAIGDGLVIVEVQQNSDTTYRVFDWNRNGLDGKPRELHLEASMASIDFEDFEPAVTPASSDLVADCSFFHVAKHRLEAPANLALNENFALITCTSGAMECEGVELRIGQMMLLPASLANATLTLITPDSTYLETILPAFQPNEGSSSC